MSLIQTLVTLFILPTFLGSFVLAYTPKEVKEWCSQTPYPQPCEYFFNNNPSPFPLTKKSDFLQLSMKLSLKRALLAQKDTNALGSKCRNELEKKAWTDCLELYEYTVEKLTKTSGSKCSQVDTQTWLSTALTNLETCKQGFYDLGGVPDYILPLMSNNVSMLIGNCLSINGHNSTLYNPNPDNKKDGFPRWVKPNVRKLLQSSSPASSANLVVATDGSGNFKTLGAAIAAAKNGYVIYVKAGVYNENVEIKLANIKLVGDGIGKTIITGSRSVGGGSTTFKSATVAVVGDGFVARDITFRNTAGAKNHQAVALRSGSDLSVFYKCSFEGYQDTLYVHSERQFYRECDIYGTVDFIFGNAAVVLQNCNIRPRNPPNKTNTITAQGRTDPNQNTGISIHNSQVTAASDLKPVQGSVKTYLGRPWKQYSRTVFMKTFLDGFIQPAGWMEWSGNFALNTLYYGEYANTGAGAATAKRVTWKGYRVITSATEASKFTVSNFLAGNSWLPATKIPFTAGL